MESKEQKESAGVATFGTKDNSFDYTEQRCFDVKILSQFGADRRDDLTGEELTYIRFGCVICRRPYGHAGFKSGVRVCDECRIGNRARQSYARKHTGISELRRDVC